MDNPEDSFGESPTLTMQKLTSVTRPGWFKIVALILLLRFPRKFKSPADLFCGITPN